MVENVDEGGEEAAGGEAGAGAAAGLAGVAAAGGEAGDMALPGQHAALPVEQPPPYWEPEVSGAHDESVQQ